MRQAINDSKPIPLIANFSMPNIFSGCNEVVVSTSCPTPAHNPFCTGAIVEYVDPVSQTYDFKIPAKFANFVKKIDSNLNLL